MTILKSIIEKNEGNLMKKYLQLLIKDLYHLQYRLDVEFRTNQFIHNKLLIYVKTSLLVNMHILNPQTPWLAFVVYDLHSFIITFQKANLNNMQT